MYLQYLTINNNIYVIPGSSVVSLLCLQDFKNRYYFFSFRCICYVLRTANAPAQFINTVPSVGLKDRFHEATNHDNDEMDKTADE